MQNSESRDSKGGRTLIGMLTPSSNTVLEPYTSEMALPMFPDLSVHFGRFRVTEIALSESSNDQFALDPILEAADLLADVKLNVIAWNGTSASWLGYDTDEKLCAAIHERTGVPATSAILSLIQLLGDRKVKRLGLVTPYTADVQARISENFATIGIEVVAERHSGLSDNFSFSEVSEEAIDEMCRDVAKSKPDAIAIVCTNMRGPRIAAKLEQSLGIPVYDSVAFTLWGCLKATGASMKSLEKYGSMFSDESEPLKRSGSKV